MIKSIVNRALRRFGYQIQPSPHGRYRVNPRFDEADYQQTLVVIKRVCESSDQGMSWSGARKYLNLRRANFYLEALDVLEAAGVRFDDARVLDIGTFFGKMLQVMHRYHPGASYFGTDTLEMRLDVARELCPFAKVWMGTIDKLDDNEHYDLIILTEVLEHLAKPKFVLQRLAGLTDRYLFLTVPDGRYDTNEAKEYRPEWDGYVGHVNFWSAESWKHWIELELPDWRVTTGKLSTGQLYAVVERPVSDRS